MKTLLAGMALACATGAWAQGAPPAQAAPRVLPERFHVEPKPAAPMVRAAVDDPARSGRAMASTKVAVAKAPALDLTNPKTVRF